MNESHLKFLASPEWAQMLETDLLPWVLSVGDLGDEVLEIGPGPGLTADLLRQRVRAITAIELDVELATALAERLAGTNVVVVCTDATDTGLPDNRFSAATSFSMLHHMPISAHQDRLFAEVHRVLQPGGSSSALTHCISKASDKATLTIRSSRRIPIRSATGSKRPALLKRPSSEATISSDLWLGSRTYPNPDAR